MCGVSLMVKLQISNLLLRVRFSHSAPKMDKMFKYKIIRNAVDTQTCDLVKNSLHMARDIVYSLSKKEETDKVSFGDKDVPVSFSIQYQGTCEALLKTIQPLIENAVSKKLLPTYSYARIYYKGSELKPHLDRESCEYSITLCIDNNSIPWAIYMDGEQVLLNEGDLVVYKGCEVRHWREKLLEDTEITQVFLHYVDKDGPYVEYKFDKRPMLGVPHGVIM